MKFRMTVLTAAILAVPLTVHAEILSAPQLSQQQDRWSDWEAEKRKIQLTGRYAGRSARRLRLRKLQIHFAPERGVLIPERIGMGTRLSISGYFVRTSDTPEFRMTRLAIEPPDLERLNQRVRRMAETDSQARYRLADRYAKIAEFYQDRALQDAVEHCRMSTFEKQREINRYDPDTLWKLVDPGPGFEVAARIQQHIRFEVFCLRAARKSDPKLLQDLKKHLPGSNQPAPDVSEQLRNAFEKDRVTTYGRADEADRRLLERLLYRQRRLQQLRDVLKPDGSNALTVSVRVAAELPDETDVIRDLESTWASHRLEHVRSLQRRQLDELVVLLGRVDRQDDAVMAVNTWLGRQEIDSRAQGVEGQLRLADDFLHTWSRWKDPAHRERGIEYLKRAWTAASKESVELASEISQRLNHLGLTRLHNRWMTQEDLQSLPPDDIELAERRKRVVSGMSMPQVESILGVPTRRLRMAASTYVEDVWIYGERRASRILVRMRRPRTDADNSARVIEMIQVSGL